MPEQRTEQRRRGRQEVALYPCRCCRELMPLTRYGFIAHHELGVHTCPGSQLRPRGVEDEPTKG